MPDQPPAASPAAFSRSMHARWGDMDFNGHMRNTAYLDAAGDLRMLFFAAHGFPMSEFTRLGMGPVITQDTLEYHRELRLLDAYTVDVVLGGLSDDGARFKFVNTFTRGDGKRVAVVTSLGGWLDLAARRIVPAAPELARALALRRAASASRRCPRSRRARPRPARRERGRAPRRFSYRRPRREVRSPRPAKPAAPPPSRVTMENHPHGATGLDVLRWRDEILAHPALGALRAFNQRLSQLGPALPPRAAHAFMASLYAFNRGTPAGIAFLAARWADALAVSDPFGAHATAATILAAAVDEFGLAGTRAHVELFAAFGARWGVTREMILDAAHAVPAARELGRNVEAWYRTAPLTESMAVHFVSEETSAEEFAAWYRLFPDAEYTRVHAQLEPGHSSEAGQALARHLEHQVAHGADPAAEAAVAHRMLAPYLALYGAMFEELLALMPAA
ncbi:MAG: thioesterase family protein [Myxococcota bacterium]